MTAFLLSTGLAADGLSLHLLTAPAVTSFMISWPTSFLPRLPRNFLQLVLGEAVILLCVADTYCTQFLGSPISIRIVQIVLQTDVREAGEFFSSFFAPGVILQWRIASILLLFLVFPFVLYTKRSVLDGFLKGRPVKVCCAVVLSACIVYEAPAACRYARIFTPDIGQKELEGMIFRKYHKEVSTPVHRTVFALYAIRRSKDTLEKIRHSTMTAAVDSCSYRSPHIVLVIGESCNRHHSSLYGYSLPTATLQQARMQAGELFLFKDAVSPWNITSNVFLDMFSMWGYGMERDFCEAPLFPRIFREAGYHVSFFSNQFALKGTRRGVASIAGNHFISDTGFSKELFSYRYRRKHRFDMKLVQQYAKYRKKGRAKEHTLDIIHLIGQHFTYSKRYPEDCTRFTVDDYSARTDISREARETVMHYDNATAYNDMVLDSILGICVEQEAIVLFVADHGEQVYDGLKVQGRLFREPDAVQARYEFEVPMWIWCSRNYREKHPDVVEEIRLACEKPFMTDDIPQILLYLAGISCEWYDDARNPLSPGYSCKPRVIGGVADYDRLMGRLSE